MILRRRLLLPATLGVALLVSACAERPGSVPEVPEEEITRNVPELDAVHEVMQPMWHDAWPARDYPAIRSAVEEFEPLITALEGAQLPGILQDEQARWDEQKALLMGSFQGMQESAASGNDEELLAYAEALHMNYEGLVRIVRPLVPELDEFHQHLYGLYHYYGPGYDLEKIRRAAEAMAAAVPALSAVELPERLAEKQAEYDAAVAVLAEKTDALVESLEDPHREDLLAAMEEVHTAYQAVEAVFD